MMKGRLWHTLTAFLLTATLAGGCTLEPLLHLRRTAQTRIVMQTTISTEFLWQVGWETQWEFNWHTEALGPVGYSAPTGVRMHVYALGDDGLPMNHVTYNYSGLSGDAQIFLGVYDLLFHNNGSEYILFRSDDELSDIYAYTRVISRGLRTSTPVMTTQQKASASTRGDSEEEEAPEESDPIDEPVAYAPDDLFVMLDQGHLITEDLDQYEYVDGKYVLKIHGTLNPASFIYLFQIRLLNNNGRVVGSMGGAALTGMAEEVNLHSRLTSTATVSVPTNVYLYKNDDPDLLGARIMTFGVPGCVPGDDASVAAAPAGKHYLVVNMNFATGKYKNVRIDVTDQIRALPTGGVIPIEIDVNDFPPEEVDPPIDDEGGGGFKALIGDWDEEVGSATITN